MFAYLAFHQPFYSTAAIVCLCWSVWAYSRVKMHINGWRKTLMNHVTQFLYSEYVPNLTERDSAHLLYFKQMISQIFTQQLKTNLSWFLFLYMQLLCHKKQEYAVIINYKYGNYCLFCYWTQITVLPMWGSLSSLLCYCGFTRSLRSGEGRGDNSNVKTCSMTNTNSLVLNNGPRPEGGVLLLPGL